MNTPIIKRILAYLVLTAFISISFHGLIEHVHGDSHSANEPQSHCQGHDHGHNHQGTYLCSLEIDSHDCELCHWLQNTDLSVHSNIDFYSTSLTAFYTNYGSKSPSLISFRYYDSRGPPSINS